MLSRGENKDVFLGSRSVEKKTKSSEMEKCLEGEISGIKKEMLGLEEENNRLNQSINCCKKITEEFVQDLEILVSVASNKKKVIEDTLHKSRKEGEEVNGVLCNNCKCCQEKKELEKKVEDLEAYNEKVLKDKKSIQEKYENDLKQMEENFLIKSKGLNIDKFYYRQLKSQINEVEEERYKLKKEFGKLEKKYSNRKEKCYELEEKYDSLVDIMPLSSLLETSKLLKEEIVEEAKYGKWSRDSGVDFLKRSRGVDDESSTSGGIKRQKKEVCGSEQEKNRGEYVKNSSIVIDDKVSFGKISLQSVVRLDDSASKGILSCEREWQSF